MSAFGRSTKFHDSLETTAVSADEYELSPCPLGLLSVDISPIAYFDASNQLLPHIELNISVLVHETVDFAAIRLQCLYAPDAEDIYCHDANRMVSDGRWLWPCRAVVFHKKDVVSLPFYFGYSCFRIFGLSQYIVNVTVFPQKCRASLLIASPPDIQLFPKIAEYYESKDIDESDLSPLLIVDLSEEDGVWLRVEGPAASYHGRVVTTSVFERLIDGTLHPLRSFAIVYPAMGLKWRNVAKGDYVVYAHIQRHDCALICDETAASPVRCRVCSHTMLNFTLSTDRASLSWRSLRRMRDSSSSILFALGCTILLLGSCGMGYVVILRRKVRQAPINVQEIELASKPTVLLLASDDCDEHAEVTLLVSRLLERHAGVDVLLDSREMDSAARPSRWLVDSLCSASHVLFIVSPCSQLIIDGHQPKQRRPFPDLFGPGFNMVLREHTKNPTSNKYIICRLPYSPATPIQLSILGFPEVEVPSELARLTALIHSIDVYDIKDANDTSLLSQLTEAIESMTKMMQLNPMWIGRRFVSEKVCSNNVGNFNEVPEKAVLLGTAEERRQVAESFGLLPPEEDESEIAEETSEFVLLPPDSSDDD